MALTMGLFLASCGGAKTTDASATTTTSTEMASPAKIDTPVAPAAKPADTMSKTTETKATETKSTETKTEAKKK